MSPAHKKVSTKSVVTSANLMNCECVPKGQNLLLDLALKVKFLHPKNEILIGICLIILLQISKWYKKNKI